MIRKYATATIIHAEVAQPNALGLIKASHRATFTYEPRPGFLYVRSRMISSRCNDNHDEFPADEIRQGWRTFIGKPVFVNHRNEDHRRMRGVIIDAALHEDTLPGGQPDVWVEGLHEVDALRFPKLAQAILSGRVNRTSMGTDVEYSICSACDNKARTPAEYCQHIPRMKGKILYRHTASGQREGHLIREKCYGLRFFENSFLVEDPADPTAVVTGIDDRGIKTSAAKTAAPQGLRFHFTPSPGGGDHKLEAHLPDEHGYAQNVGHIQWSPWDGVVTIVKTHPSHERKGIASALWQRAHEISAKRGLPLPQHSDLRTPAGIGWSQKVDQEELPNTAGPGQGELFPEPKGYELGEGYKDPRGGSLREHMVMDHGYNGTHPKFTGLSDAELEAHHDEKHRLAEISQYHEPYWSHRHALRKGAPFAGYEDFEDCTEKNADKDSPDAYCGEIKHRTEDKTGARRQASDMVTCDQGHEHDALHGGAGMLIRHMGDDGQARYLLQKRAPWVDHPDTWAFPGGGLHEAESPAQGAQRETEEEMGLLPDGIKPDRLHTDDHGGWAFHTLIADAPHRFEPSGNDGESAGHGWFTVDEMKDLPLHPGFKKNLKAVTSMRKRAISDEEIHKGLGLPTSEQGHKDLVHEQAKGLADALMKPFYEPYGGEENYRLHRQNESMMDLHRRYEGGGGKFAFDEDQEEPYYEVEHRHPNGRRSGWTIRHYADGPNAEIYHEATPGEAHEMFDIGEDTYGEHANPWGHQRPPETFGHEDLKNVLHQWHDDAESGGREHLEGRYGDPRIRRFKARYPHGKVGMMQAEAGRPQYEDPAEHPFYQANPVKSSHIVKSFMEANEGQRAQGMRWYSDAHLLAGHIAHGDHAKGAGVLAAYSPKAAWPDNIFNAARSLHEGRALGKGEGASIMGQHQRTAQKILDGEHHSKAMKSPKIGDFAHLIEHGDDSPDEKAQGKSRVVIDRHALSVAIGRRVTQKDLDDAPLGSRHYYEHVADAFRSAARELSDKLKTPIAPHQVQAVTWGVQQRANEKADAEAAEAHARGRATRTDNSWKRWEEHGKEHYPELHGEPPNLHRRREGRKLGYGETKAPQEVDTLRTESCPVCGEQDSFDGDRCQVCNFIQPPAMFQDPDTGVASQMNLEKVPFDQGMVGPNGEPVQGPPGDPTALEPQSMEEGVPGQPGDEIADLFCPACGFSADTQEPMTDNDPSMPAQQEGLVEGDVCPNCGNATMLSGNDVGEMGGDVPQEVADDANADGVPDEQEPEVEEGLEEQAEMGSLPGQPGPADEGQQEDAEEAEADDLKDTDDEQTGASEEDSDRESDEQDEPDEDDNPVGKHKKAKKGWSTIPASPSRETMTQPTRAATADSQQIAAMQQTIKAQAAMLEVAGQQLHFLAQLAGVGKEFEAMKREGAKKIADIMNPAQPVPDPPDQGPSETTDQAATPETFDDPRRPGLTPGSTNGVPAQMTDSPLQPGVTVPTQPFNNLVDVTAPVNGTETHVPLDQTKIETDVRVGDPMANADNPNGYGFPLTGPFAQDGAASVGTTTSPGAPVGGGQGRTMASLRLAKLRKAAGLTQQDEFMEGTKIETNASLSTDMINHEITLLEGLQKAANASQTASRRTGTVPKQASAERGAPSLVGAPERTAMLSTAAYDADDASDLFLD